MLALVLLLVLPLLPLVVVLVVALVLLCPQSEAPRRSLTAWVPLRTATAVVRVEQQ